MGKEWRFQQVAGQRRVMSLAGACAPHGRPRKGAVVTDGVKLRRQRVFYPDGGNRPPTTHIFGTEWIDWELKGRFSDVHLGKGNTGEAIRQWQSFVADGQEVTVQWGDIVFARGIVDSFTPERESEFECAYTIVVLIDQRHIGAGQSAVMQIRPPVALCQALQAEIAANVDAVPTLPTAGDLKPDFLDSLEATVASINGFSAALITIAGDIDAFEDATFDQLERLRAGVAQTRNAVNRLQGTMEATENDAVLLSRAADTDVQWFAERAAIDVSTLQMLAILEELDRQAEIARRGGILSIYVARLGDTWESIASSFYGGPDDAGAIRDANGVRYGDQPIPGREYAVPAA